MRVAKTYFLVGSILLLFGSNTYTSAQNIFELNEKLGRGINMGNMFEAPSETAWGNPYRDDYFSRIKELGFDHVRIPITWDLPSRAQQEAPYLLDPFFLERIEFVVSSARDAGLRAIINMHHHNELFDKPHENKDRFLAQWTQIADRFKDYDNDFLLFEILNEPHGNLSAELWNEYFKEALDIIRVHNPQRAVLMGVAEFGGLSALPKLQVPKDSNIIVTIHFYNPFTFTHQGASWVSGADAWLGTRWSNTTLQQESIKSQFTFAKQFSVDNNVPINLGEFGAYSTAAYADRVLWTNFMARWFEEQGWSWAYWEWSAGFGIFDPNKNSIRQELADALLKNPLPSPVEVMFEKIYEESFSIGTGGWNLQTFGKASATFTTVQNSALINVASASDQSWHVQFVKNNIAIERGKQYLVKFEAKADEPLSISSYIGKASNPYNSYSGFSTFGLSGDYAAYQFDFLMNKPSDPLARLVFDMGSKVGSVNLRNFEIFEITEEGEMLLLSTENPGFLVPKVYPNPSTDYVVLTNLKQSFTSYDILDMRGKLVIHKEELISNDTLISTQGLSSGTYVLKLKNAQKSECLKIVLL